jgi:hypothetical protein
MSYSPTYTTITAIEIQELARLKAGGAVWAVVSCLNAFAQGKHSCFPSIPTIAEFLGGSYTTRAIHKALRWLEQHNIIQRNERNSKKRFVLKLRALAFQGVEAVKRTIVPNKANNRSSEKNQENNHSFFSNRRSKSSSERSKNRPFWAKKKAKNRVGGKWGLPDYEADKRPQIEQDCDRILTFYFTSGGTHQFSPDEINTLQTRCQTDADYRAWMFEHNQQIAELVGLE